MQIVQILVNGDPQMTFVGIWSQKTILQILAFLTHKMGKFWSLDAQMTFGGIGAKKHFCEFWHF